jgi:acetolactate synthase-1/2/3 large subunit
MSSQRSNPPKNHGERPSPAFSGAPGEPDAPLFVYEAIGRAIASSGAGAAFGLMGEDTFELADYLDSSCRVPYYGGRHEGVVVGMADGFSWATGGLGICLLSRGPGFVNGLAAATAAVRGRRRLLIVVGDTPVGPVPTPDLKYVDAEALATDVGMEFFRISNAEECASIASAALTTAGLGRPSVLGVATDVMHAPYNGGQVPRIDSAVPAARVMTGIDVDRLVSLLGDSKLPLLLAGDGARSSDATRAIELLAERTGALLGTTLVAKDLFRGHPQDFGVVGGFTPDHRLDLLTRVDCVLAIGASLSSYTTGQGSYFREIPVIQVDTNPGAIGRNFPIELGVVGDAAMVVEALVDAFPATSSQGVRADIKADLGRKAEFHDESTATELDPRTLAMAFAERLPDDVTLIVDGGHFMTFVLQHIRVSDPSRFRHSSNFAAIGQGLGLSIGACVARPDELTSIFIGDGGMLMTLGDLETVARYGLPLLIVVLNDRAYGAERHLLDLLKKPNHLALFPDTDFAGVGRGLGIETATVTSRQEFNDQARKFAELKRPLLLDCKIRPDIRGRWLDELVSPS